MNHEGDIAQVVSAFEQKSGLNNPSTEIKHRSDGDYLFFLLAETSERFFKILNETLKTLPETNPFKERTTLSARINAPENRLQLPETQYLRKIISESLTVDQYSFGDDFFSRYIPSVFGAEEQIDSNANHIVYGRRGSGKSSLLAFLLHTLKKRGESYAWLSMQTYSGRTDNSLVIDIFMEIINQLQKLSTTVDLQSLHSELGELQKKGENLTRNEIDRMVPVVKSKIQDIAMDTGKLYIFVDDIHLIGIEVQSYLLAKLYSVSRGNQTYLKISAIEQFSKIWDSTSHIGLEIPHDVQAIHLDLSLTSPGKSLEHIEKIINAHAKYCGLPNVEYICGSDVLTRLLWVAAGVPRDALDIFSQATSKASIMNQKRVSVTSINEASSQNAQDKLKAVEDQQELRSLFERIRSFCTNERHINAFLVEIQTRNPEFNRIKDLIAYRLLHLIYEGFTPSEAGRRHLALMLDYGFYIGVRAAKSVNVFQKEPKQPLAKELRKLPIFRLMP